MFRVCITVYLQMVPPFLQGLQKKKKGPAKEYLKIER